MSSTVNTPISMHQLPLIWLEANAVLQQYEDCLSKIANSQNATSCICGFLGCFACELYLKFIYGYLQINKETSQTHLIKGHTLDELFEHLPEQTRNKIVSETMKKSELQFELQIKQCSSGFQKWRYYFENMKPSENHSVALTQQETVHINAFFLSAFCNALQRISRELLEFNEHQFDSDLFCPILLDF